MAISQEPFEATRRLAVCTGLELRPPEGR